MRLFIKLTLIIRKGVGIASCGIYDGIMIDNFGGGPGRIVAVDNREERLGVSEAEMEAAVIYIFSEIRARVPDDFIIIVNAGVSKMESLSELINGAQMEFVREPGRYYNYDDLSILENALLWNEANLRHPQVNSVDAFGLEAEHPNSSNNQKWMRVFTTLTLTHSDAYVLYNTGFFYTGEGSQNEHYWYDFWNADLGRPVGGAETKGQLYDNRDGVFVREFTNGWTVYNRSGKEQQIEFIGSTTGFSSGIKGHAHTLADLDGEIYLKMDEIVDLKEDGVVGLDTTNTENATEWMPDVNLRIAITEQLREKVALPEGVPLRKDQVRLLRDLSINGLKISDLTGLEHAVFLKHLNASGNEITDLQPLANLVHLNNITLNENQIVDISPLVNLTDLMWLNLGGNQISDLAGLERVVSLQQLDASGNQIIDLQPLANLVHLNNITLNGNQIVDISPLVNLTNLMWLNLGGNQISDITPLRNLTKLKKLAIAENLVEDISIVENFKDLLELRLNDNRVTDISPILNLPTLEALNITDNPVKNIAPLLALDIVEFEYDEAQLKASNPVDVTGDGVVNILDLVAVANAFGKAEPDLNGDGVVNIQDLVIVANAFRN